MSVVDFKSQAARLGKHLRAAHGVSLKHASLLTAVANLHGTADWNTLAASGTKASQPTSAGRTHARFSPFTEHGTHLSLPFRGAPEEASRRLRELAGQHLAAGGSVIYFASRYSPGAREALMHLVRETGAGGYMELDLETPQGAVLYNPVAVGDPRFVAAKLLAAVGGFMAVGHSNVSLREVPWLYQAVADTVERVASRGIPTFGAVLDALQGRDEPAPIQADDTCVYVDGAVTYRVPARFAALTLARVGELLDPRRITSAPRSPEWAHDTFHALNAIEGELSAERLVQEAGLLLRVDCGSPRCPLEPMVVGSLLADLSAQRPGQLPVLLVNPNARFGNVYHNLSDVACSVACRPGTGLGGA